MAENCIYGVKLDSQITPLTVRDAMVDCFYKAHCADSGLGDDDPVAVKKYCSDIIVAAFTKVGGSFDNPTKDSIFAVLGELAEFAKNFRNPAVIKGHFNEIMKLVELLD